MTTPTQHGGITLPAGRIYADLLGVEALTKDEIGDLRPDNVRPNYNTSYYDTDGCISNYAADSFLFVNGNAAGGLVLGGDGAGTERIVINTAAYESLIPQISCKVGNVVQMSLFASVRTPAATSVVIGGGSISVGAYLYLRGEASADGSVRVSYQPGSDAVLTEKRVSGSWVTKLSTSMA